MNEKSGIVAPSHPPFTNTLSAAFTRESNNVKLSGRIVRVRLKSRPNSEIGRLLFRAKERTQRIAQVNKRIVNNTLSGHVSQDERSV